MLTQPLLENWELLWQGKEVDVRVPCSLYTDLYRCGAIPDPYFRDNETAAFELSKEDCAVRTSFDAPPELLACPRVLLRFEGVDTLAEIVLNGTALGRTFNMHRVWEFSVRELLRERDNRLEVRFSSPLRYLEEQVRLQGSIP